MVCLEFSCHFGNRTNKILYFDTCKKCYENSIWTISFKSFQDGIDEICCIYLPSYNKIAEPNRVAVI